MGNIAALGNTVVQTTPVGVIEAFAGVNAPAGWLFCDGSAISRIQYPELFSALSTTYGSGDGSTTFNLPDMRGRMPVGKGTHADVATLGNNEGASLANRRPKHQHTTYDPGHNHGISDPGHTHQIPQNRGPDSLSGGNTGNYDVATYGVGLYYTSNSSTTGISINNANTSFKVNPEGASSSTSPSDAPPYLVVNYIIKAFADLPRGGWFYQNQPPVVTQLPSNPQIGEEVYYYSTNGAYIRQRWDGTQWIWLSHSKPPSVRCSISASTQSISSGVQTSVQWTGTDVYDTDSMHDPAVNNTRITFNTAGVYTISFGLANSGITNLCDLLIMKNGSTRILEDARYMAAYGNANTSLTTSFSVGDYITADLYHTNSTAVTVVADNRSFFSATWLGRIS